MTERTVTTEWGTVSYQISDDVRDGRKTLFFLHGMTGDHTMFDKQVRYFSGRFNLLTWDAPAHGKSRPFADFTYEKAANAVKMIFETEGIGEAVFIGQSMGGFITQAVIKRYPELVYAFVSIDSTPYGTAYYSGSDIWWLRQVEWMAYLYPLGAMKRAMAKQVSTTKEAYQNMLAMLEPYGKRELCHLMGIGYAGFLADNCDLNITCPVLLLLGENDRTGKVKAYNRRWAEKTGYPLVVIRGAGHNANVDQPEAVNREIEAFIT